MHYHIFVKGVSGDGERVRFIYSLAQTFPYRSSAKKAAQARGYDDERIMTLKCECDDGEQV